MTEGAAPKPDAPHVPVLLRPLLAAVAPVTGVWIDGTFGAGGYARGLIEAGAEKVIGIDRDPLAHEMAARWLPEYAGRIDLVQANFAEMDSVASDVDGVVLDLGVSSMQLDQAERGFSFMRDGPLDMRMGQDGSSAADIVNEADAETLADILFTYGEERASRRIARAILREREVEPITTTLRLAGIIEGCLPRPKPNQSHPATRSFQALRIAVNDEYRALYEGLMAAERALKPGGALAVVTFHSVEDRMVKRFLQARAGQTGRANRFQPLVEEPDPQFELISKKAIGPDAEELAENPRARSAKLRVARRTDAPSGEIDAKSLNMPELRPERTKGGR
ncbi:Ribosomal RNA small subunit methyltransferase H [Roseivivax sp. THAF40]|uniref:16S rRNA (cytosine(1402)-N(4))-methyltransferase RsmH n=1 Tax=unclassified Roseivivax TaxID=2639302 RepID=UPI001267ADB5|nr:MULTISPECIES: 16S rRNA (cytosine(1402)-N(4))-methyltransferase RsmH [unclassified Roseivivax]QFS83632.1 Ribosomal RNA small subunit methyltransferase H [Roseivivax sp. THAF197b]QFT47440.1 Ribosomal RNA small subunit methyltransferase H [Roseivivax sp. THAF40]